MALVAGVRWLFRDKDAGSARSKATGATEHAALGANSSARRHSRYFANLS